MTPTPAAIAELLDHPDRLIELFAVHNFRDVGGYPTNDGRRTIWRKVFRADGLYRLTPEDIEALRQKVSKWKQPKRPANKPSDEPPSTFVINWADLQLGKSAGGGVEATVERVLESLEKTVQQLHDLRP